MISGTGSPGRWQRLGALLIQRRTQINPRFHNRGAFCEATGLNYRLVYDIEEARRTNFGAPVLAAIEVAYQLKPGTIARFLVSGELEPQDPSPPRPAPPRREIDFSGNDPEGLEPYRQQVLREVYAAVGLGARFSVGDVPEPDAFPGIEETLALLPPSRQPFRARDYEADVWDNGMMLGERVTLLARIRRHWAQADEAQHQQTGLMTGLYPASSVMRPLISVAGTAVRASS